MPFNPLRDRPPALAPTTTPAPSRPAPTVESPVAEPWYTPEQLKGWLTSLGLHAAVLLLMGLWYFKPPSNPPKVLDTRLMGVESGVAEGLTATGGLNTPLELTAAPDAELKPALAPTLAAELSKSMELTRPAALTAKQPSAGGGMDNPNPGAGNGDGFGLARFGQGGESIRGVEVKVGDPQFTLLWDSEADLDLHVIEPGGKEIYWEERKGQLGGELDVDNQKGFGPENIYWLRDVEGTDRKEKGPGPPGEYRYFVVYWGGFGGVPKPTRWKIRVKHGGSVTIVSGRFRMLNERSKVFTLKVEPPSLANPKTNTIPAS